MKNKFCFHRNQPLPYIKKVALCTNVEVLKLEEKSIPNITNSVALVRERTTPIERPPLVGEIIANLRLVVA
jgi:hypothetical protein